MKKLSILLIGIVFFSSCTKDLLYDANSIQVEIDKAVDQGYDGMIVYVDRAGEKEFYSSGWDDREAQIPADPHTLFKVASISKLFLASAAAMLIAREQLTFEQTLTELIPETKDQIANADEITLKMLLQHRSGIIDYSFEPEVTGETEANYLSYMARVYGKEAEFKPDRKYSYSNSNYLLLGEILNRTLGYSHHDFIQAEILDPLGLINTYNVYKDADTNRVMRGYLVGYDKDLRSWDFPLPGGNMISTAEEVGIFLRALVDGTLLSTKEQEIYSVAYTYEHTGWLPGYTSIARYHSDIDAVVVQFVNTSDDGLFWIGLERTYDRIVKSVEKNSFR